MQGSAKKNLFMLKKLCGADGLKNVLLVSTMWEIVDENTGSSREQELVNTEEFWGVLIRSGARVKRHDNGRESAMRLLKELVQNKKMAMSIQKEMVTEGKTLDQTQAGIEIESELQRQREKFKQELAEVQEMMHEAMEARDQEAAEALRQHKADTQRKLDKIVQERKDLKMTMQAMHVEKFAELDKKHQEQMEEVERKHKMETDRRSALEQELKAEMDLLTRRLEVGGLSARDSLTRRLGVGSLSARNSDGGPAVRLEVGSSSVRNSLTRSLGVGRFPAVPSPPGPCHIRKRSSVALCGKLYCLLGPKTDIR
ncbi:hypothetical protein IMZ48_08560 [Candidatus Bathyarchaeota archaeon]|nr:hypothetical protein [Candidatus Bathyarchaeota archaeon]